MTDNELEDTWDDWEEGEDDVMSLFSQTVCSSGQAALAHDKDTFGFDLVSIKNELNLDLYGMIKVVNFVRSRVAAAGGPACSSRELAAALTAEIIQNSSAVLQSDQYLQPFLEEDALLFSLDQLAFDSDSDDDDSSGNRMQQHTEYQSDLPEAVSATAAAGDTGGTATHSSSSDCNASLRRENAELKAAASHWQARAEASAKLIAELTKEEVDGDGDDSGQDNDTYYFNSYAHISIHQTMLRDTVRTGAYESAIASNPHLFKGKTVLDVGCGTGVLSMFAARAGAARVIGIDMSDIIHQARKLVAANGYSDVITLLQGKMEDVKLPVAQVDVIISEWMGYCLFYETMLPAVLYARSKYLAPEGVVLPDQSPLFIEGVSHEGAADSEDKLQWWHSVHGLDFSILQPLVINEALVTTVPADSIVTSRAHLKDFDAMTLTDEDLDFEAPFEFTAVRTAAVTAVVVSFDIGFTKSCTHPVWFSTGAQTTPTHWQQTLLWLQPETRPKLEVGDVMSGSLKVTRNAVNPRELDLQLAWAAETSAAAYRGLQDYKVC